MGMLLNPYVVGGAPAPSPGDNRLTWSDGFENWSTSRASVTAGAVAAPSDGDVPTTADKLLANTETNAHFIYRTLTSPVSGTNIFWVDAKSAEWDGLWLYFDSPVSDGRIFDLSAGTVGEIPLGGGAPLASGMTSLGGGWWRCWITTADNPTTVLIGVGTDGTTLGSTQPGSGSQGLSIRRAQYETGSTPNGYTQRGATIP